MEEKITYVVKVNYKGTDGYGYGLPRSKTETYNFDALEKAESYKPEFIAIPEGTGVMTVLFPESIERYKITTITERIG